MSLTTLLERPEIRNRLREEFPKPPGPGGVRLAAPPLTESYSLTGTAFDYLLRWYTKKLNPHAFERKWIAETALFIPVLTEQEAALDRAKHTVMEARKAYTGYLSTGGQEKPGGELIAHAIRLAFLDSIFRAKILDESTFGPISGKIVEDLTHLLELVKPGDFLARKICVLNPIFGEASKLVRGADGDMLLDERLIELKTTKALELERKTFDQLIGYYILSRIGGISGCSQRQRISRLAVYYSRYGVFWEISVRRIIDGKHLPALVRWFKKAATRANASSN